MIDVHEIPQTDFNEICRLEAQVQELILIADTLRALRCHHQGGTIVAMTPTMYLNMMRKLVGQTRDP